MQRANFEPDVFSYASRLRAFAKAGRGEEAQYFFKTMIASGIKYVIESLISLSPSFSALGLWEKNLSSRFLGNNSVI